MYGTLVRLCAFLWSCPPSIRQPVCLSFRATLAHPGRVACSCLAGLLDRRQCRALPYSDSSLGTGLNTWRIGQSRLVVPGCLVYPALTLHTPPSPPACRSWCMPNEDWEQDWRPWTARPVARAAPATKLGRVLRAGRTPTSATPPPPLVNSSPTRAQGGSRICHLPPQTEPSEAATARAPLSETTE